MPVSDHQLTQAWDEVLRLSKVQPGQSVTILTGAATHPQTLRAAMMAAQAAGAVVSRVDLPPVNAHRSLSRDPLAYLGETPLTGNPAAIAALKASDLVIDLMTLLFSAEQIDILESGTKILLAVEPPEVLVRTVPTEADRTRVLAASAKLRQARQMRVVSDAGTDVTFDLGEFPTISEYGFVDEPGRWDHWPSGFLFTFANEGGSRGTIVVDTGDILLPQKSYTTGPIRMTVEKGYVTAIEEASTLNCSASTWPRSMIPRLMRCRTSAGACSRAAIGPRSPCTTRSRPSRWTHAPSRATSFSRWDRTTRRAASARPPAISTFRCGIAL